MNILRWHLKKYTLISTDGNHTASPLMEEIVLEGPGAPALQRKNFDVLFISLQPSDSSSDVTQVSLSQQFSQDNNSNTVFAEAAGRTPNRDDFSQPLMTSSQQSTPNETVSDQSFLLSQEPMDLSIDMIFSENDRKTGVNVLPRCSFSQPVNLAADGKSRDSAPFNPPFDMSMGVDVILNRPVRSMSQPVFSGTDLTLDSDATVGKKSQEKAVKEVVEVTEQETQTSEKLGDDSENPGIESMLEAVDQQWLENLDEAELTSVVQKGTIHKHIGFESNCRTQK